VLGRYPEARWQKQPPLVYEMQALQRKLLAKAAGYLSKGGVLVYATCSLEPEENETIIDDFLAAHPDWHLMPVKFKDTAVNGYWRSWSQRDKKGVFYCPDGFFIAKLGKGDN
jgi:16S rRNA (cytosine967-C5)-methyltransferase